MKPSMHALSAVLCASLLVPTVASAGNDVAADPSHHKVEFENDCVRVVRATFKPGEKSDALFETKGVAVVSLTGATRYKIHFPDGKFAEPPAVPAGAAYWAPGAPGIGLENTSDATIEYIVVEPKTGCVN